MSDEENNEQEEQQETPAPQQEKTAEPEDSLQVSPLLKDIIQSTKIKKEDDTEAYDMIMHGLHEMVKKLATSEEKEAVSKEIVDSMIAELDRRIGIQLNRR